MNGAEIASAVTDPNGSATTAISRSRAKKNDTIEAVFDGDATYASSRAGQRVSQN